MPHYVPAAQPAGRAVAGSICLGKENNPTLACVPDFTRSKIPVPTKSRPVPDFKKLHESWKAKFHKGKAVSKKSCTRPCPFSLTQKGERFQILPSAELVTSNPWDGCPEVLPAEPPSTAGSQNLCSGGPLKEISFEQNNAKNTSPKKPENGPVGQDFRADPKALATILNNVGVTGAQAAKPSLPLRVPLQGSSLFALHAVTKAPSGRMSAYGALTQRPSLAFGPKPRPSILAEQGAERRGPGRGLSSLSVVPQAKTQLHRTDATLQATEGSPSGNQANNGAEPTNRSTATSAKANPTGPLSAADGSSCPKPATVPLSITSIVDGALLLDTDTRQISRANVGNSAADFVSDPSALASILSNTGLNSNTFSKGGKLSVAQRVPVRGKGANSLYSVGSSRASGVTICPPRASFAPRADFSRMSCVPNLGCIDIDVKRTPQAKQHGSSALLDVVRPSPLTSAGRVPDKNPYSSHFRSLQKKRHLIFPKTPQALALEAASKLQNSETAAASNQRPTIQESSSRVKWSDGLSPQSASQHSNETPEDEAAVPIEKVAVRLFLESETYNTCQDLDGDSEKAKALLLKDMAHLQHIENLSKQLQQEMAAYASRLFPDLPISQDRPVIPNSPEPMAASKDLHRWDGTICNQRSSVEMPQPPSTIAHWQGLQKGQKDPVSSGVEPQPLHAIVCDFKLSEPHPPQSDLPFLHTSRAGLVPSVHTAFQSIATHSSHSGVIFQDHPLSCIPGNTNADYQPFLCNPGTLNTETQPFPNSSIDEPHPGTLNTVHHSLSVPAMNTEHCPLLGASCTETTENSSLQRASGVEHQSPPYSSSPENQFCLPSVSVPGLVGSGNVLKMSTTPTFSSQGSICSNLPIHLSKVPAGSAVALGAPWVRPDVPRPSLKQMFQHIMVSFQEVCLDDECCFYTSKPAAPCADATLRSETSCKNPLATMLELEEAMHFSPIKSPKI
ncbi:tastin isoform X2 [Lissotriton helveticus]